ncbi:hypothetical protein ABLE91_16860 [Aquabacter sp. CN5-332]|uniref:hypothetical protein n=1 Tax=Aquabacter sp. CN5-332 TaxID=3156608 RepID=UPI0032B43338
MKYLAKPGSRIPMPDSPGQFVPDGGDGTTVNELLPYYARLIADQDLVPATPVTAAPAPEAPLPEDGDGEGDQ